jgi:O-6-methylguanine DNA methyltransferase
VALPIVTGEGVFIARYSERGLQELDFPAKTAAGPAASRVATTGKTGAGWPNVTAWHRLTESALQHALAGSNPPKLPPLDWTGATDFQQSVWREMLKIPCGETRSYGQIAKSICKPAAVRAVGGACGANPVPVLVPCHRVLAAHGRLGGFGGGLDWKRRLLAREGILFELFGSELLKPRNEMKRKSKAG